MSIPVLSFRMAYRHVRAGVGRVTLSIVALALGVALVVAIQLMNGAVLASFLDIIDGMTGRAALTVSAGDGIAFDERLVDQAAEIPGVTLAVPLVTGVAFPDDGSGELLTIHGVDIANDAAIRVYHRGDTTSLVDDVIEFLNSKNSIVLGREFAERRGLSIGDELPLVTPTGIKTFRIRGLLDPEGLAKTLGGRLVVMDVYAAELAFTGRGQINQIDLVVESGRERGVKDALERILPAGLTVEEPSLRKAVVHKTVAGFQAMLNAFAVLGVLAGFVICYSRLSSIFVARTWEVGLLRAVGLGRAVVFVEMLKEALLLGVPGALIGIALGRVIGERGLPIVATTAALNFRLPVPEAAPALTARCAWIGLAVGLGAAVLAAVVPALRLSRKQPIAALTLRGRELPIRHSRDARVLVGMIVLIATLLVVQQKTGLVSVGNVTTIIIALLGCVCARPLVDVGTGILMHMWDRAFGAAGKFGAAQVRQRAQGAALTIATLGIGLGAVVMFGVLAWSFERTLVSVLESRMRADLVINSAFASSGYVGSPISDDVITTLLRVQGVANVAGEQQRDVRYEDETIVLDAYDPSCFDDERLCHWVLDENASSDELRALAGGDAAMVSTSFARRHGTKVGDTLTLTSPHGPFVTRVVGITNGQPASSVIISRSAYSRLWNDSLLSWIHVAVSTPHDIAGVQRSVELALADKYRVRVRKTATLIEYFAEQARSAFRFVYVMEVVIFILLLVGIGDTLATSVLERTRMFGMMRAVGLPRSQLFAMVLLEGGTIGVLGLVLAIGTGLVLGTFWVRVQFPALLGWTLDLHFPYVFVLAATGLTLLLCVIASVLPSLRAAYIPVTGALRAE